ncbi:hypothetical protein ACWEQ0_11900 [Nocardia thailandica]
MPVLVCLNEHSCTTALSEDQITAVMRRFVRAVRDIDPKPMLVTPMRLPHIELSPGYPMARWADRNKDLWRALRLLQDRAPYSFTELASQQDDDLDYHHGGVRVKGLGLAYSHDGLAASLPTHERWAASGIGLDRTRIDDHTGDLIEDTVEVRHLSCADHIPVHQDWFDSVRRAATVTCGAELWEQRDTLFPALTFLPEVAHQLQRLDSAWVQPVFKRLRELQIMVEDWRAGDAREPTWHSKVTPEYSGRRAECRFTDLDGVVRTFDTHLRFQPGPGRLHLRMVHEQRTVRIAWIGRKLGI